jgi:hypothetical protein
MAFFAHRKQEAWSSVLSYGEDQALAGLQYGEGQISVNMQLTAGTSPLSPVIPVFLTAGAIKNFAAERAQEMMEVMQLAMDDIAVGSLDEVGIVGGGSHAGPSNCDDDNNNDMQNRGREWVPCGFHISRPRFAHTQKGNHLPFRV